MKKNEKNILITISEYFHITKIYDTGKIETKGLHGASNSCGMLKNKTEIEEFFKSLSDSCVCNIKLKKNGGD